ENLILTNDQLSEYIINEDDIEFDDYMVYEVYAEMTGTEKETSSENQEYINYLIENDIDINSIIEEL
ncbi:MAG: hypothetical protein HRT73_07320, partial [Flavobacteriales bacterium]|nr:hypothetical protein [Flavobacteriales bacterium]